MKKLYLLLNVICWVVLLQMGCGRKGDPIIPVVPQPLPVQNVSARIDNNSIILSWALPSTYDTGKSLKLKDIKTVTVSRKTEIPAEPYWDFSQTSAGWTVAGKAFPLKWYKGVLRTASEQKNAFIISPKDLSIKAESMRYIRLKFWSKNSDRGYIAFITKDDTNWDTDLDLKFQPAVHTSFYSYQNVFNAVKLKSFQIPPVNTPLKEDSADEYIIDMGRVPSWKGEIKQVGIVLHNPDPEHALVELGLDSFEFTNTLEGRASIYESSPWLFLEDEEGWRSNHFGLVFGAVGGVLYAQGSESVALISSPGQNIKLDDVRQIQVRMKVTSGDEVYLVLLRTQGEQRSLFTGGIADFSSPNIVRVPLKDPTAFHTYTIKREEFTGKASPDASWGKEPISQVAIFFPTLTGSANRHILIDYVHILESTGDPGTLLPFLIQKDISPVEEIEQQVRQKIRVNDPEFDVPYDDLPSKREQVYDKSIKLVEISPQNPGPVVIQDGIFSLTDTGEFSGDDARDAPLNYGERYTYIIELSDRRNRKSVQSGSTTIEFTELPIAPYNFEAKPGDGEVRLTWGRPFLAVNGRKIKSLTGYNIFRSLEPEQYPGELIYRASPYETMVTDKNLANGITYYYRIQSVGTTTPDVEERTFSLEVSATPADTIPPDVPTGLVGVYLGKTVNVFWNLIQTKDLVGFNIYRSEDPTEAFRRINPQPILQSSYRDMAVEPNKRYYYYVTAFDDAVPPNESQPSEVTVVETFTSE